MESGAGQPGFGSGSPVRGQAGYVLQPNIQDIKNGDNDHVTPCCCIERGVNKRLEGLLFSWQVELSNDGEVYDSIDRL